MRVTPARAGGGRERAALVAKSYEAIAEGSHSFAAASKLFDRTTRERSWLLYAWCRRCDDIADNQDKGGPLGDQGDLKSAEDRVQAIRVLTKRALDEQPTADFAFDAFGLVADECGLDWDMANDMIGGFALDATRWQPRTEADMMRYCYHVAGSVGIMMAVIMGVPKDDGETLDRACDLGLAFQIANIARDITEDAEAGRCYLPATWLAELDWEAGEHALPENRFKLASLMPRLIALMEKHEAASKLGAKKLRFRQRWAVLAAANIYGAIGRKVLSRGQLAWDKRVRVGGLEKSWHVTTAFFEALWNRPSGPQEPIIWSRHDFRPVAGW
ncbi:phytoene/squalene synthase family protein [Qipengyuania nanhaisediminis]|uniref:Farnesyl-diphosphate farnesyltransferase n=1 Tax=Qipengyuania nanhaisediminis TaxID=604088 RepID=A0A1I5LIH8_9SPHN|nr:phytoene/squalene synthase family protein [Qipengyuania nanhaisediminis]SFO96541.1 farnesyl-diphosphate farnesyltransferase [Qipengyuania nanhaisediminis]